ncbi:MAG: hypothetical protein IRY99_11420 [Isosphaeraceae bacterium]|nr:hypothetical protein [Isosphaeraceae bacterium]
MRRIGADGEPIWTTEVGERGAVFSKPGRCYRTSVSSNAGLKRYRLGQTGADASVRTGFGIFGAPEPWGPWTTIYQTDSWDVAPGESCSFPTTWMSPGGAVPHLVFSGDDSFSVRRVVLRLAGDEGRGRARPLRLRDRGDR